MAEFSGAYAAVDGRLELKLDIAGNDTPGTWQVVGPRVGFEPRRPRLLPRAERRPAGPAAPPPAETANPVQPKG